MKAEREWCFEPVPGYFNRHVCHLKYGHKGKHRANLCGRGHKGGRAATWTTPSDLSVSGAGVGTECDFCTEQRRASAHPNVRLISRRTP